MYVYRNSRYSPWSSCGAAKLHNTTGYGILDHLEALPPEKRYGTLIETTIHLSIDRGANYQFLIMIMFIQISQISSLHNLIPIVNHLRVIMCLQTCHNRTVLARSYRNYYNSSSFLSFFWSTSMNIVVVFFPSTCEVFHYNCMIEK